MSIAEEIEKLDKLQKSGVISIEEFIRQKNILLGSNASAVDPVLWPQVPLHQKWWLQAVLILLIVPIGIIFMLFSPAYRKKRGYAVRVGKGTKALIIILSLLYFSLMLAKSIAAIS